MGPSKTPKEVLARKFYGPLYAFLKSEAKGEIFPNYSLSGVWFQAPDKIVAMVFFKKLKSRGRI
jgi:hypothetical protein